MDRKAWLITGGAGFFGARLVELVLARHRPSRIVVFSRDELKQHELKQRLDGDRIQYLIGDVRDGRRLLEACLDIDCVIHAAALKQVGACEENPLEAVKTNVLGSANVIDAALRQGVERALAISSDKAVDAAGVYGATKLCCERLFAAANRIPGARTRFAGVRCGNIAASPGSVIPAFVQQRERGVIKLRDPRMTRFYFSSERAAEFTLSSLARMEGGEIFVPRMPALRILDLAKAVASGCRIEITGVGPGEKIHEALLSPHELDRTLEFPDRFVVYPGLPAAPEGVGGRRLPEDFSYCSDAASECADRRALFDLVFGPGGPDDGFPESVADAGAVPAGAEKPPFEP